MCTCCGRSLISHLYWQLGVVSLFQYVEAWFWFEFYVWLEDNPVGKTRAVTSKWRRSGLPIWSGDFFRIRKLNDVRTIWKIVAGLEFGQMLCRYLNFQWNVIKRASLVHSEGIPQTGTNLDNAKTKSLTLLRSINQIILIVWIISEFSLISRFTIIVNSFLGVPQLFCILIYTQIWLWAWY